MKFAGSRKLYRPSKQTSALRSRLWAQLAIASSCLTKTGSIAPEWNTILKTEFFWSVTDLTDFLIWLGFLLTNSLERFAIPWLHRKVVASWACLVKPKISWNCVMTLMSDPANLYIDCQSSPTAKSEASGFWCNSDLTSSALALLISWNSSIRIAL